MLVLIIGFLFILEVKAEDWWQLPRTEDDNHYYYVGIAEGKGSSFNLQDQALNKAMGELIREHFGMSIQISESAVEELKGESFQVVTTQNSAPLFIKGVSQTKTKEVGVDEGTRFYVQIRVDKKTLAETIAKQLTNPGSEAINTYGETHGTKVDIKVKTHPQGATINFTHLDQRYSVHGQGDAVFYLPRGRYQMVTSKPGYSTVTDEMNIEAGGRIETVTLVPVYTELQLRVVPEEAKVEYLAQAQGDRNFKLRVAQHHRFRVSHPDYVAQEFELFYEYPSDITKEVVLEPKPSTLKYNVTPGSAQIEIDGNSAYEVDGKIQVKPGERKVRIFRHGYFDYTDTVEVEPNREYPQKVIKLQSDDINISPSDKHVALRFDYNPFLYHEDRGRLAYVPLAVHIEWYYISLGVGYSWINEKEEIKDETMKIPGSQEIIETDFRDTYATLRLISPRMGPFKFFIGKTMGNVTKREKNWEDTIIRKKEENYEGTGGGFRFYINPRWSFHGEYEKLIFEDKETQIQHKSDRFRAGFSYEF